MEIDKESIDMEECIDLEEDALNLFLHWDLKMEAISVLGECGIKNISILKSMHSHDVDKIFEMRHFSATIWRLGVLKIIMAPYHIAVVITAAVVRIPTENRNAWKHEVSM